MAEFIPMFAYVGPETILPVTSALAAIGGAFLAMGRSVFRVFGVVLRPFRKRRELETEPSDDSSA